jgi:hypothetical protein
MAGRSQNDEWGPRDEPNAVGVECRLDLAMIQRLGRPTIARSSASVVITSAKRPFASIAVISAPRILRVEFGGRAALVQWNASSSLILAQSCGGTLTLLVNRRWQNTTLQISLPLVLLF